MDMDQLLDERYRFLFNSYGTPEAAEAFRSYERNEVVPYLKKQIESKLEGRTRQFRPDALLFLLINLDQMVIRACFSPLETKERILAPTEVSPDVKSPQQAVDQILAFVLDYLDYRIAAPVSGHEVLQAIDKSWKQLAELFKWA